MTRNVTITRAALSGSRRAAREWPPLPRNELSEKLDEDTIEVPAPLVSTDERKTVHVLHVDDSPDLTELSKMYLEDIDDSFEVTTATSPTEGLTYIQHNPVDCIISDYEMPTTDGIEFLEIIRERRPDLPFILYTGKGSEEVASEAIAAGVTDYMQKEMGADQYEVLANRVRNAVERYRTQQRFWDALSWYRRLVEQDLAGVFLIQDAEFVYVNERLACIFGYSQEDLIDTSPLRLAADDHDETRLQELMTVDGEAGSEETFQYELIGVRADGTELPIELHGGRIQYEGDPGCIGLLWASSE